MASRGARVSELSKYRELESIVFSERINLDLIAREIRNSVGGLFDKIRYKYGRGRETDGDHNDMISGFWNKLIQEAGSEFPRNPGVPTELFWEVFQGLGIDPRVLGIVNVPMEGLGDSERVRELGLAIRNLVSEMGRAMNKFRRVEFPAFEETYIREAKLRHDPHAEDGVVTRFKRFVGLKAGEILDQLEGVSGGEYRGDIEELVTEISSSFDVPRDQVRDHMVRFLRSIDPELVPRLHINADQDWRVALTVGTILSMRLV